MENERIAKLETQMKELIGNGQPGRVDKLEQAEREHSRLLWLGMGAIMLLQVLGANGWVKLS